MQVKSFINTQNKLDVIDVQVVLLPGLPQIQFLGQADSFIKESSHRIRSAIKNAGFQFPLAQQVLVDLKPHELKKKSLGLELAVAYCILVETGQIKAQSGVEGLCFYGELGLRGEVQAPQDIFLLDDHQEVFKIFTGQSTEPLPFDHFQLAKLSDLTNEAVSFCAKQNIQLTGERPQEGLKLFFNFEEARILSFLALSEHSVLMAGPAGVGKTTLAKHLMSFLKSPSEMSLQDAQFRSNVKSNGWRPMLKPHFTSTVTSLIGGGDPLRPGDLTRAHGGVLILDEFLEFAPAVQEALRTPMEEKKIVLSRGRAHQVFPCETLVVATTNLCPCGKWTPGKNFLCNYNLKRCRSVLQRLSGPLLDRFDLLYFKTRKMKPQSLYDKKGKDEVNGEEILEKVEQARAFRKQRLALKIKVEKVLVSRSDEQEDLWLRLKEKLLFESLFEGDNWSYRRQKACLRLAGTIADLEGSEEINERHVEEAYEWSCCNFLKLTQVSC